jgi:predicted SAM-dependent methyltransferase
VDIAPPADEIVDLSGPWPWPDSSVEEVLALDVCEHIGDRWTKESVKVWMETYRQEDLRMLDGRIHFMNELHRVLKPGAQATIETPNAARGCGYYQDPTHVSPWCLSTFKYFEHGTFAHGRLSKAYGITAAFRVLSLEEFETSGEDPRERAWKIKAVLEAVK